MCRHVTCDVKYYRFETIVTLTVHCANMRKYYSITNMSFRKSVEDQKDLVSDKCTIRKKNFTLMECYCMFLQCHFSHTCPPPSPLRRVIQMTDLHLQYFNYFPRQEEYSSGGGGALQTSSAHRAR
jgi:hypothetical protein